ncbi:hypothetical protein PMAYCL1PPCAC_25348 [Pristionchus mayeri]|uniref:F-box domain-containing protein n=1 Tax=Pristionchus mayeri TaxID=1317129 RepID=A0AAN5I7D9_9BILA|nr:hypothetical protein PMAYCL1PPCAC_25348 [Pristionchus mayeri]
MAANSNPAHQECDNESLEANERSPCTDVLSELSNDCFLDVLSRVDHNDLDEMEQLNRRMCRLAEYSRSKAAKIQASELFLMEGTEFKFMNDDEEYVLNDKVFRKASGDDQRHFKLITWNRAMSCSFTMPRPVRAILLKYSFAKCSFTSIILDCNFLDLLDQLEFREIDIIHCFFSTNMSISDRKRFSSILLAAKPRAIKLNFPGDAIGIDEEFLRDYASSVHLPSLSANFTCSNIVRPNSSILETLSKFGSISTDVLEIDSAFVISALKKRLRAKSSGSWGLIITSDFTQNDIEADLEQDLKYTSLGNNWHQLAIAGTRHNVVFRRDIDPPYPFVANFQE